MNRWWGSKEDSDKQASERDQRSARRVLNEQQLLFQEDSASDGEYADCNLSASFILNLDGAGDDEELAMDAAARELARQRGLPVEDADFENDSESWKKELKTKFNIHEVDYFFNAAEAEMKKIGINRQWDKKNAIAGLLPDSILQECMPILRLLEPEAGDHIYKDLKHEILSLYDPREEDAFKKPWL